METLLKKQRHYYRNGDIIVKNEYVKSNILNVNLYRLNVKLHLLNVELNYLNVNLNPQNVKSIRNFDLRSRAFEKFLFKISFVV